MRGRAALLGLAALAAWAGAARAQDDFLEARGKLPTPDFYRLVSCRALPGGPCAQEPVAWPPKRARRLVVALARPAPGDATGLTSGVALALDHAVGAINGAGAGLHLARAAKGARADVTVHLGAARTGEPIRGTGRPGVDGEVLGAALVTVWWDDALHLTEAVIVVASDLPQAEMESVILEELVQATGLMTDIRDPFYEGVSVLSEDSNCATRLGAQDVAALRLHYPPDAP